MDTINPTPVPDTPVPSAVLELSSVSSLMSRTVEFYKKHFTIIITLTAIYFIANILPLFSTVTSGTQAEVLTPILTLAAAILSILTSVALLDTVVENGMPQNGLAGAYRKGMRLIWAYFITGFLSGLAVFGATLLLVIPGIIMGIMLSMSTYIVFAENKQGGEALAQSWHYVKGHAGAVFWRTFLAGFIVWFVVFVLIVALALIFHWDTNSQSDQVSIPQSIATNLITSFLEPLAIIYMFLIYTELKVMKPPMAEEELKSKKRKLMGLYILGVVAVIAMIAGFILLATWFAAHQKSLEMHQGVTNGIRMYLN